MGFATLIREVREPSELWPPVDFEMLMIGVRCATALWFGGEMSLHAF